MSRPPHVHHELAAAQASLTAHTVDLAGRCIRCDVHRCQHRDAALRPFWDYAALPARVPMASRPELLCARRA